MLMVFFVHSKDGINMKKINCYSKIASLVFLIMFFLSTIIGIPPFILFKEDDNTILKIIWIGIVTFCLVVSVFVFFIINNILVLKMER